MEETNYTIAVIGQGYVGIPLALEFSKYFKVIGFDIDKKRINELSDGNDHTKEANFQLLNQALKGNYSVTHRIIDIKDANVYIVTVPTPLNIFNTPDLSQLLNASKIVASVLKKGDIVIYESTVYPGCTEEDCVPILEKESGLKYNEDFFVGYSPERIVPGDKINTLTTIKKVTSGSNDEVAAKVDDLYKKIITAGTHKASSIKIAEASKAIENAQRDVNISFVNELALIFDKMNIDTTEVLEAAGTKFNFLKFRPGLVGGHCISVDPYYLAHKSEQLGYYPQVILSGRRVNNYIPHFIASKVVKLMIKKGIVITTSKALILGITFKENCPDIRNSKVIEVYKELKQYGMYVDVYDPWANKEEVFNEFDINLETTIPDLNDYNLIILTVAHKEFSTLKFDKINQKNTVIFDVKSLIDKKYVDARL